MLTEQYRKLICSFSITRSSLEIMLQLKIPFELLLLGFWSLVRFLLVGCLWCQLVHLMALNASQSLFIIHLLLQSVSCKTSRRNQCVVSNQMHTLNRPKQKRTRPNYPFYCGASNLFKFIQTHTYNDESR